MNTLRYAILEALEKRQEERRQGWRPERPQKPKPPYPGTKRNLAPVDASGRELSARILNFFGENITEAHARHLSQELMQKGVAILLGDNMACLKLKLEKDRWDVPVARMYWVTADAKTLKLAA